MNGCNADILSRYVDLELSLAERREVGLHLRTCRACALEVEQLRETNRVLSAWGTKARPVPLQTEARLARSIEQLRRPRSSRLINRLTPAALGSAAAAVLLTLALNVGAFTQPGNPAPVELSAAAIRHQSAPMQRNRAVSAILGVQVTTQNSLAGRRLALLDID